MGPIAEVAPTEDEEPVPHMAGWEAPAVAEAEVPRACALEGVEEAGSSDGLATREPVTMSTGGVDRAKGSGTQAIPSRPSLMNQGKRAERLMKQVCLPEFQAELCGQSARAFFREAYITQLWVSL